MLRALAPLLLVLGALIYLFLAKKPTVAPLMSPSSRMATIQTFSPETPTPSLIPTRKPTSLPTRAPTKKPTPVPTDPTPWGVAKQIGEHTYTMKIAMDDRMATPLEILDALNQYRQRNGSQKLNLDETLAKYAQSRADFFATTGGLDEHAGFEDFVENQDGHNKLGFDWLGENISFGYKLTGTHLIEWVYAGDKPHDDNQRDNRWNYVGIGVNGTATCLIFGAGKH